MSYSEILLSELKQKLISNSYVIQLESIDEIKRRCVFDQEIINKFHSTITILAKTGHPWVRKEAIACLDKFKRILIGKKSTNIYISSLEDYLELLKSFITDKHRKKISELIVNHHLSCEDLPSTNQLKIIIENKIPNYLIEIFSEEEIIFLCTKFGILVDNIKKNIDFITLEIYKKLGFKLNRSDFLEF